MAEYDDVPTDKRSRAWRFTLFNFDTEENHVWKESKQWRYIIFGTEHCPTTDRLHWQGYVYFDTMKSFRQMKKIHQTASWRIANASHLANYKYCTKEDKEPFEWGVPPDTPAQKGEKGREHYLGQILAVQENRPDDVDPQLFLQYKEHGMRAAAQFFFPTKVEDTPYQHYWFYGEPRSGKSTAAKDFNPKSFYLKSRTKMWDGYAHEDIVIINEFGPGQACMLDYLKEWGDQIPFRAEIKFGSMGVIRPKVIIITSNHHPDDIFTDEAKCSEWDRQAIRERYKIKQFFKTPGFKEKPRLDYRHRVEEIDTDELVELLA